MFRTTPLIVRPILAAAALLAGAAALPAAAGAAPAPEMSGAPKQAEVRFEALLGIPPGGYSLFCTGFPSCSTRGNIDLATKANVDVAYDPRQGATRGVAPLPFSSAEGDVGMSFTCEGAPDPWVSEIGVVGTKAGELEISEVESVPGTNTMKVALNHGGDSGSEFPQETVARSDGGCDSPVQDLTQKMGTWYYHFYVAHRSDQQQTGNDLEIGGLSWKDGVYTRTFDRFVTVGSGAYSYPTYERTRIEVEPEYCAGKQNRITSATAQGGSLGLDGLRFYPGQVVNVPPNAKFRLGDGSVMQLENGGSFRVDDCETNETKVFLGESVDSLLVHVKKALAGSSKKFDVVTERAVVGVRGTIFEVSYDKAKELTKVAVEESSVSLKGRNGAKGEVIIEAGQIGVQKGTKSPRIVKR